MELVRLFFVFFYIFKASQNEEKTNKTIAFRAQPPLWLAKLLLFLNEWEMGAKEGGPGAVGREAGAWLGQLLLMELLNPFNLLFLVAL